jgi:ABC-type glycerol-3-phosphate transport system substrate-binding protein
MHSAWRNIVAVCAALPVLALAQAADPSVAIVQSERADRPAFLARGAKTQGEVVVYTSLIAEDLAALSAAFEKKYGVKVKGWRAFREIAKTNGFSVRKGHTLLAGLVASHPHAAMLFADFMLSPEGQAILERGGYVPASLRVASPARRLTLRFADPAMVLDEDAKWKKLYAQIVLGNAR